MDTIRVVLIEDHDLTRMGMRTALKQQEGIEVIGEAKNANSGLKLLNSLQADVAIVDVGLPDMSGVELTQIFKNSEDPDSPLSTKILILTMNDSEDTVLAAFAAGADSYYMKDASIEKLADAIRVTHEGNSWIDPAIARIVLRQSNNVYDEPNGSKSSTVTINSLSQEESEFLLAYPLTARELDVLRLIVDGCSNAQIAEQLYITVGTVKTHVRNILNKLSVSDRTQVAVRALRAGLVN
ncbi:response regulator transcription factor [Calothrix membranacea FACHB-236]|nr:response regulator transcription factor [Calothrix membranacea FACHB-236]